MRGGMNDTPSIWAIATRFGTPATSVATKWPTNLNRSQGFAVYGNIDGWSLRCRFKQHEVFTVEGLKVLMTHIGGYPGKYAPGIRAMIMRERPDIFISGHSHILKIMNDPTLHCLHINPGAAGRYGIQTVSTLVLLKLDSGKPVGCNVIELAR